MNHGYTRVTVQVPGAVWKRATVVLRCEDRLGAGFGDHVPYRHDDGDLDGDRCLGEFEPVHVRRDDRGYDGSCSELSCGHHYGMYGPERSDGGVYGDGE